MAPYSSPNTIASKSGFYFPNIKDCREEENEIGAVNRHGEFLNDERHLEKNRSTLFPFDCGRLSA
jgi:hypothetical protein